MPLHPRADFGIAPIDRVFIEWRVVYVKRGEETGETKVSGWVEAAGDQPPTTPPETWQLLNETDFSFGEFFMGEDLI
jgi:hypothetical protein